MENVVLIIHLLLALTLIAAVLLQKSEGGLGSMGGGAGGGAVSGRSAATAMTKLTWIVAAAFIGTSIALTIIAAEKSATGSVVDRLIDAPIAAPVETTVPDLPLGSDLLPPSTDTAPLVPSAN